MNISAKQPKQAFGRIFRRDSLESCRIGSIECVQSNEHAEEIVAGRTEKKAD